MPSRCEDTVARAILVTLEVGSQLEAMALLRQMSGDLA